VAAAFLRGRLKPDEPAILARDLTVSLEAETLAGSVVRHPTT